MGNKNLGRFTSIEKVVDLGGITPLGKATLNVTVNEIMLSPDCVTWFKSDATIEGTNVDFLNETARYIKADKEFVIEINQGQGYIATYNHEWTKLFSRNMLWTGGDGFYTFNLKGGNEAARLSDEEVKTLCVFGDTLSGTICPETNARLEPLLMPNQSIAIIDGANPLEEKTEFIIGKDEKGHLVSLFEPTVDLAYKGSLATNLVREGMDSAGNLPWCTTYYPNDVVVTFDLNKAYELTHIDVYNYSIETRFTAKLENRGLRYVDVFTSDNGTDYTFLKKVELEKADRNQEFKNYTRIDMTGITTRYVKFETSNVVGVGNFGGANGNEPLFGLSKVRFATTENRYLIDVLAGASTELHKDSKRAWYWLQDGVYINDTLYFFPLVVRQDLTQAEGFQFGLEGVAMVKVPVENEMPNFEKHTQKDVNLAFKEENGREWYYGAGFLPNTKEANAVNPDGYIYVYGYTFKFEELDYGRIMRVARVLPENIENINEWRFYNGKEWTTNPTEAAPLLDHVSCELSVSYDDGQYIAVFTYDVQSRYVAYATSPTPYGPFTKPRIAYVTQENGDKVYWYNAKAHPHLTQDDGLVVAYNVNTASMSENEERGDVYAPRFINLKKV